MALELTEEQTEAGWTVQKLGDIARVVTGGTPSKSNPEYWGEEVPFLTPSDQQFGVRLSVTERFLSEEGAEGFAKKMVPAGAAALTCIGATIGKISWTKEPTVTNQQINSVIAKTDTNGLYLYYKLSTCRDALISMASGSATPIVSKKLLESLEVQIPPRAQQDKIAEVLGSLDDKIEANNTLLNSLDELGNALILQKINDVSETCELSEIAEVVMGQSPAGATLNEDSEGLIFYQGRRDFGFRYPTPRVFTSAPTRLAEPGDILLSVRAPVGDLNRTDEECCVGRGIAAIRAKNSNTAQLFYLLKNMPNLWFPYEGEGTVFSSINRKQVQNLRIPVVDNFEDFEDIEKSILSLTQENLVLSETRDLLIRKLIK